LNFKQYQICIENYTTAKVQKTSIDIPRKKKPTIANVFKCKVCRCEISQAPPRIHDCKIKNLWDYKNSRYLTQSQLDNVMEEFKIERQIEKIDDKKIKVIDRYLLNTLFTDSKTILTAENTISTDLTTIKRIINGTFEKSTTVTFGDLKVETIFSNEEVIHLAFGVREVELSKISRKYFKGIKLTSEEWVLLHNSMMSAARELGKDNLLKLLDLNKIDFRSTSGLIVFDMLKKLSQNMEKPSFRINFHGHSFLCQYGNENNQIQSNLFQVSKLTDPIGTNFIFRIDKKGKIHFKSKLEIKPTFQLIQAFCNNTKQLIIGYGMEEGRCSICNNLLTDNQSKLKGIGPICERNIFGA
jgi:hypothetical protein